MLYKEKIKLSNKLRLFSKEIVYFSRKALEYNDSMIDFKEYMGETFYLLGRFDEAIKVYKNLLEIAQNPRKDKHKLVLGKIFIELHDHNKAVEVLKDFEWKVIKSLNFKNILKENIDRYKFYQFSFLKKISNYYFQKQQYQKALNAFKDLFLDGECCFLDPKQEKDLIRKLIACYRNTHQINRVYELIGLYFPGWEYNEIILNKLVKFIRNNYTKTNN
jgi:tetratricopeptide (TPR) repeat protein